MTVNKTTSTLDRNKQKKAHFPYRTELPGQESQATILEEGGKSTII